MTSPSFFFEDEEDEDPKTRAELIAERISALKPEQRLLVICEEDQRTELKLPEELLPRIIFGVRTPPPVIPKRKR